MNPSMGKNSVRGGGKKEGEGKKLERGEGTRKR